MFWNDLGDDFLFDPVCSLNSYGLLFLRNMDNLLSVFFEWRDPLGLGDHLFEWTLFWLVDLTQLIVGKDEEWNEPIWGGNSQDFIILPSEISMRGKMPVPHSIKRLRGISVVNQHTVGCRHCKHHVIRLLEHAVFRVLFGKKHWTKLAHQSWLFVGWDGERWTAEIVFTEQVCTTGWVFLRTWAPDSAGQDEQLSVRWDCWPTEKWCHWLVGEHFERLSSLLLFFGFLLFQHSLLVMVLLEVFFHVPVVIKSAFLVACCWRNHFHHLVVAHRNDVLDIWVDCHALHSFVERCNVLEIISFSHSPKFHCSVHAGRYEILTVFRPSQINNILTMSAESYRVGPLEHFLLRWEASVGQAFGINDDFLEIIGHRQKSAIGRVLDDIDVTDHFRKPVFAEGVVKVIKVELPEFDTARKEVWIFLLCEDAFLWAGSDKLVRKGMKVDGEDSLLFSVPSDVGRKVFHVWVECMFDNN